MEDSHLSSLSLLSLSLSSNKDILSITSKTTENSSNSKSNRVRNKMLFRDDTTLSAGCVWLVGITSYNLPTNESRGDRKRKYDRDLDSERATKKVRGNWSTILNL